MSLPTSILSKISKYVAFSPTKQDVFHGFKLFVNMFCYGIPDFIPDKSQKILCFPNYSPEHIVVIENVTSISLKNAPMDTLSLYKPIGDVSIENCPNVKTINVVNPYSRFFRIEVDYIISLIVFRSVCDRSYHFPPSSFLKCRRMEIYNSIITQYWDYGNADEVIIRNTLIMNNVNLHPVQPCIPFSAKTLECSVTNFSTLFKCYKFDKLENLKIIGTSDTTISYFISEIRNLKKLEWITDNPSLIVEGLSRRPIPNLSLKIHKT